MGENKIKAYPLRLDPEIMEKLRYIAEKEDRPLSKQIERIIKNYLETYEQKNGSITINIGRDNNGQINL